MIRCTLCLQEKTRAAFPLRKDCPQGFYRRCKKCEAARASAWRKANRFREAARNANRHARDRHAHGVINARDVETVYILQGGFCPCGADLSMRFEVDHVKPIAVGGDNHNQNIQLLCKSCNCRKGANESLDTSVFDELGVVL